MSGLVEELIEAIGLGKNDLERIILTAPARYKVYPIRKRDGGERTIAQPARELKAIQRYVLAEKLNKFPVHPCAMAYEVGRSIAENADQHRHSDAVLKLDFQNFFPSILVRDWEAFVTGLEPSHMLLGDLKSYSKILFWGRKPRSTVPRCLSIGAPTSPKVSNVLMYRFDTLVAAQAEAFGVKYTRYADDITLSGDSVRKLEGLEKEVRETVRLLISPKLSFNEAKRGLYRKGQRRMVTGLVLTPERLVSIGRERKRKILALLHRSSLGQLETEQRSLLKGLLGFSIAAEPSFVDRLRKKYGNRVVDQALRFHAPRRSRIIAPPPDAD